MNSHFSILHISPGGKIYSTGFTVSAVTGRNTQVRNLFTQALIHLPPFVRMNTISNETKYCQCYWNFLSVSNFKYSHIMLPIFPMEFHHACTYFL